MKKHFFLALFLLLFIGLSLFILYPLECMRRIDHVYFRFYGLSSVTTPTMAYFEKNNCTEQGPCTCIALLHGLSDSARTWSKVLKTIRAEAHTRVLAFDLPGSTDTLNKTWKKEELNVTRQSELVAQELKALCPKWTVVGNSLGGWISIRMALKHPELFHSLIVASTAGFKKSTVNASKSFQKFNVETLKELQNLTYAQKRDLPDFMWERILLSYQDFTQIPLQLQAQTEADFLDQDLIQLKVPLYIVWGKEDKLFDVEVSKLFLDHPYLKKEVIVPSCGHLPQKECPEVVIDVIREAVKL